MGHVFFTETEGWREERELILWQFSQWVSRKRMLCVLVSETRQRSNVLNA